MTEREASIEFDDSPREECGVVGIYAPGENLAEMTYYALLALQHRGQQGAGISITTENETRILSAAGEVTDVFKDGRRLGELPPTGITAVGQDRYGTANTADWQFDEALQPMLISPRTPYEFVLGHNGHIEGLDELATEFGLKPDGWASDTQLASWLIDARFRRGGSFQDALHSILPRFDGAYSLVMSHRDELVAARDPYGFRPLHLGKLDNKGKGWVVASEISALNIIGADPVREIAPGEMLTINSDGIYSSEFAKPKPAVCSFEFVYFSRPDNQIFGELVGSVRRRMGMLLAQHDDIEADIVIGVPESGRIAAAGYSEVSGIPNREEALVRNFAVKRSFITPNQIARVRAVRTKLNPVPEIIKGNRVVLVDDSVIRGTTSKSLVKTMWDAGASEVHLRVSSGAYIAPCHMGMDTGRVEELLAAQKSHSEMEEYLEVNSLRFLSHEDLQKAVGNAAGKMCTACTTGINPIDRYNIPDKNHIPVRAV